MACPKSVGTSMIHVPLIWDKGYVTESVSIYKKVRLLNVFMGDLGIPPRRRLDFYD